VTVSITGLTGQLDRTYTIAPMYLSPSAAATAVPTLGEYGLGLLALLLAGGAFVSMRHCWPQARRGVAEAWR
jgi:hypothetical protein